MLSVIILNVVMLSVVMLSVMAPVKLTNGLSYNTLEFNKTSITSGPNIRCSGTNVIKTFYVRNL